MESSWVEVIVLEWTEFWALNTTYVNEKHRALVDRETLKDQILLTNSDDTILDFGCGEALKFSLAKNCFELSLFEGHSSIINRLLVTYKDVPNIKVLRELDKSSSYSLIFICSVSQYIPKSEFYELIKLLKQKLKPDGRWIISDIVPVSDSAISELSTLAEISLSNGFFVNMVGSIFKMLVGDYSKVRKSRGLTKYHPEDLCLKLKECGFTSEFIKNIGINDHRFCISATHN